MRRGESVELVEWRPVPAFAKDEPLCCVLLYAITSPTDALGTVCNGTLTSTRACPHYGSSRPSTALEYCHFALPLYAHSGSTTGAHLAPYFTMKSTLYGTNPPLLESYNKSSYIELFKLTSNVLQDIYKDGQENGFRAPDLATLLQYSPGIWTDISLCLLGAVVLTILRVTCGNALMNVSLVNQNFKLYRF